MSDRTTFSTGDKVRHRDAPEDGPVGTVTGLAGNTADGAPIYQVAFRSRTGSASTTRYPVASLVLVERAEG
jgi:hypothetical protein